ncbi:hypothetical protein [Shewanella sp. Isolate11]|uniref:hypothetical protein n=1 Tax=Shewanella sp. Isolate11 TaxID=2908530 RepID=UPI001EFE4301|nr:hypothetical protein [Shewanella sp. Isolate11]MCG9698004.1 hypothetical protein [Shewanella sp. Isolate11]
MKVHLITNCTNNKRNHLDNKISFSDILNKEAPDVQDWVQATANNQSRDLAINTYAGDHWKVVRDLHSKDIPVWVLSAGFGFISSQDEICSYDATFSTGVTNSVSRFANTTNNLSDNITWWNHLHANRECKYQYDLSSMVKKHKHDFFCISASPQYLKVILPELLTLAEDMHITAENTIIISSKIELPQKLKPFHILSTEDFCEQLQGSRVSLNIRLARYLLEKIKTSNEFSKQAKNEYLKLKQISQPAKKFDRKKMSDNEVSNYINEKLKSASAKPSATTLLAEFRNEGYACEQKRFGKIFKHTREL